MKTRNQTLPAALALTVSLCLPMFTAFAQDSVLSYQGRVKSSGTNFSGAGQFKFALVTVSNEVVQATAVATISGGFLTIVTPVEAGSGYSSAPTVTISGGGGSGAAVTANVSGGSVVSYTVTSPGSGYTGVPTVIVAPPPPDVGYTTYWSNDGSSVDGSEPTLSVGVQVHNGLFTVRLGDNSLPNMLEFPTGLFKQPNLRLRTWFNDGIHGFVVIDPAHRLTAVAYAMTANLATVADALAGLIQADQIAPNAITSGKILDGGISPEDLGPVLRSNTFWRLGGNADTTGNVDFIGTTDNEPFDLRVNNMRGFRLQDNGDSATDFGDTADGAPNVIGGSPGNRVGSGVVGATIAGGGATNFYLLTFFNEELRTNGIFGDYGTIGGGLGNGVESFAATIGGGFENEVHASADYATIAGGSGNRVHGDAERATIAGGFENHAEYVYSTVGGGAYNSSSGTASVIAGGQENTAEGEYSTIGGGRNNEASGNYSFVGGGSNNIVTGGFAVAGGGLWNVASGAYSVVAGGRDNLAEGNFSFAAGRKAWAYSNGSFAWGDSTVDTTVVAGENEFKVRASGGAYFYSKADLSAGVRLEANATAWTTISDRNAKKDFTPLDCTTVLDRLMNVPVQNWRYKWEAESATPHIGPTAQDFKAAFYPGRDDKGITTLEFDGVALAAIQGLNAKVESGTQKSENRMEQLEAENTALKHRLEKLERLVHDVSGGAR